MKVPVATLLLVLSAAIAHAQRLPGGTTPIHYDITVAPDLAAATFGGQVRIRVQLAKPSATIVLHAAEITFRNVRITAAGATQEAKVTLNPKAEQATFHVAVPIPAGEAEIAIAYDGILNDNLRGLYLSRANNRRYAVTQLEATDARRMFPSFDEPALKATFALTAIVDRADHAVSNGAIVSDRPGPGEGKHTIEFETTPKMSTYLVALAVGDFECNEGSADGIPVRICATPDKKHLTGLALQAARQQLEFFNRYYSIRYPFKKLDVVAVPDFAAGAMENTAAIFYRETLLLAGEDASVDTRRSIAEVLAHEIAHQWFGNIVTMQWWDDIWLNEGFATWMMSKPVKAWRPDWNLDLHDVRANQVAMELDALRTTRSIRATASTTAEIAELFDPIAYEKGAAVLRMLEGWLGEETFRKGVNAYIEKYQYANARAEDFWGTLTEEAGKPVDEVMSTFVDQPGLPLVTVAAQCAGGTPRVVLSQERYVRVGAATAAARRQRWQIPVCFRTDSGATSCDVLRETRKVVKVDSCPAWVMGNAGGRGYYRTMMSPAAVGRLRADVARLSPAERMVVLDDELALVRAGKHDVGTLLDLASGFGDERTPEVVAALTAALRGVAEYVPAAGEPGFRAWVSALLAPAFDEVGLSSRAGEPDAAKALRRTVVAFLGGVGRDPRVLARAREMVSDELEKAGTIEPTLLSVLVELAAVEGDAPLYDRYLARAKAATAPEDRYQFLNALTVFTDPALVRRTMDLVLSPEIRSQDTPHLIARLLRNPAGPDLAWDLIRARWPEIEKKTGEFLGTVVIVGALSSFCEPRRAGEIRTFFAAHPVPDAARTLQQSLERIASCGAVAHLQGPKLAAWLKAHTK